MWALLLLVTVKCIFVTIRADNRGKGGSFALLALIRRMTPSARLLPAISAVALPATALFFGCAITIPAISILSAVEGVTLADALLQSAVLPVTLVIVAALFAAQHRGTGIIGRVFGPVISTLVRDAVRAGPGQCHRTTGRAGGGLARLRLGPDRHVESAHPRYRNPERSKLSETWY